VVVAAAPKSARSRDYFVRQSGAFGAFQTVQSAVDAVEGQTETDRANIFISPGTYVERVVVDKPFVTFIGRGAAPADVNLSSNGIPNATLQSFGETVSIGYNATAFMARNLTFENSLPDRNLISGVALACFADRAIFDNVRCLGYQDTLLVDGWARQYFRNSFITGDTDFIFGNATAVFDRCTIESTDLGWITAADTDRLTANGLIFLDCELMPGADRNPSGDDGTSAPNNSVFLGRPWFFRPSEQEPSVTYIRTRMGPHIARAGWDPWDTILDPSLDRGSRTRVSEWGSMNLSGEPLPDSNEDGTPDGRVPWAHSMTEEQAANYTLQNIFGPVDFWNAVLAPGIPYETQGAPWNPDAQLLWLPARPGSRPQLLNISTRLRVGNGHPGIAGFIITGRAPKKVILRAIGPSLRTAGLIDVLADPVLELHDEPEGNLIAANDNWKDDAASAAELESMGMTPADEHESAMVVTVEPGQYTAVIGGNNGSEGTALVEVYDDDLAARSQPANVSTLGFVGNGDDVLIAGFVVGVTSANVVVRALGPSLGPLGVANTIEDPTLEVHTANGDVTSDDDWQMPGNGASIPPSLQPLDPRESAIQMSLAPGSYTAIVAGKGMTGVALVEVYNVQ
jgi:pectin methylesterase-like acyl-CoA thioesterase